MKALTTIILIAACCMSHCHSYSMTTHNTLSRRIALGNILSSTTTFIATLSNSPEVTPAKEAPMEQSDISILLEATDALSSLLANWERATVDCTYADVPRELLEVKNKEKLLEKASEFALFDKSTSVVSCKRTNRIVRDYIGSTGKGPLVAIEKRLLKKNVVEKVDPEYLDEYIAAVELFSQALSRAKSLSYTAGVSDFDAVNNFAKDDTKSLNQDGSNLDMARKAVEEASSYLGKAVSLLTVDEKQ